MEAEDFPLLVERLSPKMMLTLSFRSSVSLTYMYPGPSVCTTFTNSLVHFGGLNFILYPFHFASAIEGIVDAISNGRLCAPGASYAWNVLITNTAI